MGVIGGVAGKHIGSEAGKFIGSRLGRLFGGSKGEESGGRIGGDVGGVAGGVGGALLPFKKGGRVKRTGKALVHKGEFILPKGVPPTKTQIKKVRKRGGRV